MPEIEDQAASNAASAVKAQKPPKKGGNTGVFNPVYGYVALALGVLSLAGAGYGIVQNMNTSKNLMTVYKTLDQKIATVQQADPKELAISDETIMTITQKVRQDVDATLAESVQSAAKTYVSQVRNDLMVQVDRKIRDLPLPSADVDPALVNALVIQALKSQSSGLNKDEQARREVAELRTTVEGISAQLASGTVAKAQPLVERSRLKGFNIVGEPLKNNTLFVVDAPKKDGSTASNSITLVKGEGFLNKWLGSQRVEGIEKQQDGKYRLLISGGYFIDSKREEYTKEELLALKPAPKKQAQKKATQQEPTEQATRVAKAQTPTAPTPPANKVYLTDWFVIMPKPDSQEVVVFNPITVAPIPLSMNKYVDGIGTVQQINFKTGETCFERYCVQGKATN